MSVYIGGEKTQCIDCVFYSMWEGNCCFPGKNFIHVAYSDVSCKDFVLDEQEMSLREKEENSNK